MASTAQANICHVVMSPLLEYSIVSPADGDISDENVVVFSGPLPVCKKVLLEGESAKQKAEAIAQKKFDMGLPKLERVRRVAFIKLRKTGGTTFASSVLFPYCAKHGLSYMFPRAWPGWGMTTKNVVTPASADGTFHMLFRHFPEFPAARKWLDEKLGDPKYLTILRNPVDRAVSNYNHYREHYNYKKTFDQYLDDDHPRNHQSEWLGYAGDHAFLLSQFDDFGITDRMRETILLFRRTLNLTLPEVLYVSQRKRSKGIMASGLSGATKRKVMAIDSLDMDLFDRATDLFEERISGVDSLAEELDLFNSALNDYHHPLWKERGEFKIGYIEGSEWAEFSAKGELRQLKKTPS